MLFLHYTMYLARSVRGGGHGKTLLNLQEGARDRGAGIACGTIPIGRIWKEWESDVAGAAQ